MALTQEQQQFATENHNLIYSFMNKHNLSYDDWYDVVAIGFCKAVTKYDPNRNVKFSTFAYHLMTREIQKEFRKSKAVKRRATVVSLQSELCEGYALEETLAYDLQFTDTLLCSEAVNYINSLDAKQKKIIYMLCAGKTQKEIGNKLGVSQVQVSRYVKGIRERFKNEYLCMEGGSR